MAQKPETVFRVRVTAFLKTLKNTAYFPIQQVAIVGTPDFMACIRGDFFALELKRDGKQRLKGLQAYNKEWVTKAGGQHLTVFPENWEQIKLILSGADVKL